MESTWLGREQLKGATSEIKGRKRMKSMGESTVIIKIKQGHIKITDGWIHDFYIKKRHRNKGYGSSLIKQAINLGGYMLYVNIYNTEALNLYRKIGFVYFSKDERKNHIDMIYSGGKQE